MNRLRFHIILISCLFCWMHSFGQTDRLNKIIPPSPQLSQFAKYGDYPVDHSTGIPGISIPLYEIATAKLKLPISISYHASGFKVDDQSGTLGMGWSLQAGGRISRTVQGAPDELVSYPSIFKNETDIDPSIYNDFLYLRNAAANEKSSSAQDTEYDIFNFSMDGDNGKFVLARGSNGNRVPTPIPFRPIKFNSNSSGFNSNIEYIEITNEQGVTYRFGRSISDNQLNVETAHVNAGNRVYTSGWFLSEVISYDKSETIKLIYSDFIQVRSRRTDVCVVEDDYSGEACVTTTGNNNTDCASITPSGYNVFTSSINNTSTSYDTKVLKEIQFPNGKVVFNYSNDALKRLIDMDVLTSVGQLIRKVSFGQAAFPNHVAYSKLTDVRIKDAAATEVSKYSFDYNETVGFPDNGSGGDLTHTSAVDYWGFFNGKSPTGEIVPRFDLSITSNFHNPVGNSITQNQTVSFGDRDADEIAMKTFILNKITYPTGGTTEFEYEANRSLNKIIGGLRIHRIKSTASQTGQVIKRYAYGQNENGEGELTLNPYSVNAYMQTYLEFSFPPKNLTPCPFGPAIPDQYTPCYTKRIRTISSDFVNGSGLFDSNPVFYTNVTEYQEGLSDVLGKTAFTYELPVNGYGSNGYSQFVRSYASWQGGHLIHKYTYKKEAGNFYEVAREDNYYTIELGESLNNLKSVCRYYGMADKAINIISPLNQNYPYAFEYFDYRFENGRKILNKKVETLLTGASPVVKEQVFSYNNYHNNPVLISTKNSVSGTVDEELKYPTDLTYSSGSIEEDARQKLIAANNKSLLVEKKTTNNGIQVEWIRNIYKDFNANGIPFLERILVGNNGTLEERAKFGDYINGNLGQQQVTNGNIESYLWGYNSQYPVAKIVGADRLTAQQYVNQSILDNPSNDQQLKNELNNIRTSLPGVQVNSYTYQPLAGMTSETDANGKTTYYEYDSFQRLKVVKDQNNNILKTYCYNYAGQLTDCNSSTGGTTPSGPVQVYARVEVLNPSWSAPIDGSTAEADIYVALYSDAACTQPVSLPQAINVDVSTTGTYFYNNYSSTSSSTNTYSIPANTNRMLLGRYVTDSWYSYYDPYYGTIINSENYTYQVEDNGANVYFPSPTY